jgi:uncharacterized protein YeaO (DUF488 family)
VIQSLISIEKSIYDLKSGDDGLRVLIMRYWPRGVRKEKVDVWFRDLGTSPELIKRWKSGKMTWEEFRKKYLAELKSKDKQETIRELATRAKIEKVTLLCGCHDANRCHRSILKQYIERMS